MIYKKEFVTWSLVNIGWLILNIVFYEMLFLNVHQIQGWNKGQVLVLLGFYFLFEVVLWGLLWPNMREIPIKVNTGTLDLELTKPINSQFLVSFKTIDIHVFNSLILGAITIAYGLYLTNPPSIKSVLLSALAFIIASIFVYAAWFITMCIAFWTTRIYSLPHLFPGLRQFSRVPHTFYQGFLRVVFTFLIPVTLVTTVPTQFLIEKASLSLALILACFAILTLAASNKIWKISLTRYSSASS
jgi:ABC-2 type transport system permease protein